MPLKRPVPTQLRAGCFPDDEAVEVLRGRTSHSNEPETRSAGREESRKRRKTAFQMIDTFTPEKNILKLG